MSKLAFFELDKIWRKRSFLLTIAALLLINVFILWYTNLSDGTTPELSAYKAFQSDIADMSESEKEDYIKKLYQDIQGMRLVNDVLNFRASSDDMGKALAEKVMKESPGVFEQYYDAFMDENYLKYTGTLEQETSFITDIYKETEKVFSYDSYLKEIQNRKDTLIDISIFSSEDANLFSKRNIEKEAWDYAELDSVCITFYPSKGIVSATQTGASDILLTLSVFLFVGGLIYEEKEKKLFFITRATVGGRAKSIIAKLSALAIHCISITVLIYGANLLFFAGTTGVGNLFRSIQSVAPFMESNLQISVLAYLLLTVFTKAIVLFSIGVFLVFTAISSKQSFMPYLVGSALLAAGVLLYVFVPFYSSVNWLKFLNFIGLMKTENMYGSYLNFNLFAYPISRLLVSWIALGVYTLIGMILSIISFLKCENLELRKIQILFSFKFKPHSNLYRHEGYKILIMNRAVVILFLFSVLLGYHHLSKTYTLTPTESYYQSIMLQLEGELTLEKEALIESEDKRYEEAFGQIDRIDALVASGEIDAQTGESMKMVYYSETAFYPSFQRVLEQYEYVKGSNGDFVYDTGYFILFGFTDNGDLLDWILLSACMIFAFSHVFAMEYQKKSWNLLSATVRGKRQISRCKILICMISALVVSLVPWICRLVHISRYCPLHELTASTMSISGYREIGLDMPIFLWIALMLFSQLFAVLAVTLIVLLLSNKMKNHLQVLFASALILLIPPVLAAMGFVFAGWCSIFPFYNMASGILAEHGVPIMVGYLLATVSILIGAFDYLW